MRKATLAAFAAAIILGAGCASTAKQSASLEITAVKAATHDAYVAAFNSNDVDTMMALYTNDAVLQPPGAPDIVGKAAIRDWVTRTNEAYRIDSTMISIDFSVSGDVAYERFTYDTTLTDRKTGKVLTEIGKGILIFQRGEDGERRASLRYLGISESGRLGSGDTNAEISGRTASAASAKPKRGTSI